jgi:hypothetical protein
MTDRSLNALERFELALRFGYPRLPGFHFRIGID